MIGTSNFCPFFFFFFCSNNCHYNNNRPSVRVTSYWGSTIQLFGGNGKLLEFSRQEIHSQSVAFNSWMDHHGLHYLLIIQARACWSTKHDTGTTQVTDRGVRFDQNTPITKYQKQTNKQKKWSQINQQLELMTKLIEHSIFKRVIWNDWTHSICIHRQALLLQLQMKYYTT